MKRETLKSILPFVKEYAAGRGEHKDQKLSGHDIYTGNAVGAIVSEDRIKRLPFDQTYCYDGLNGGMGISNPQAILLQLQPCPSDLNEEAYRHYIQWVLNYSPWRHVFVSKSINKVMKDGVVIVDTASQKNTMIGGCIAIRQAWDNYARLKRYPQIGMWWDLIQKVNPVTAFAITSNVLYIKDGTGKVAQGIIHAGHSPICGSGVAGDRGIDNFARGNLIDDSVPFTESRRGKAWAIWEHGNKSNKLPSLVMESLSSIGKGKEKVNPFGYSAEGKLYNYNEVIDCLISEIPNMEKEIGV